MAALSLHQRFLMGGGGGGVLCSSVWMAKAADLDCLTVKPI